MRFPWKHQQKSEPSQFRLLPFDPVAGRITFGLLEDDSPASILIRNQSGVVVGGRPGSGKTAGMMIIVLALYLSGQVNLHIIDGKGGDDWTWAEKAATTFIRDDIDLVHEAILNLNRDMKSRTASMRANYGESNFWNLPPDKRPPLEVIIVDECQTYFDPKGVTSDDGRPVKELRDLAQDITGAATNIVRKGRSAGYLLFAITQKPTTDCLPSQLRDNCGARICFQISTPEAARAVLGNLPDGSPSPLDIPTSRPGGAVIGLDNGQAAMCRFAYISENDAMTAIDAIANNKPVV